MTSTDPVSRGPASPLKLTVLGQFSLRHVGTGGSRELPVQRSGQRLLALLALHQRPVRRTVVTDLLWGDSDERHASWSLRSTLHRLPRPDDCSPVQVTQDQLALTSTVHVDLFELGRQAHAFHPPAAAAASADEPGDEETLDHLRSLERDVLPDWYEDWVIVERERHRQLRLHALESLARRLIDSRRYGLAVHAGLAAVHAEPLRESAHAVVIRAHLAEGNAADALRQYGVCRRQLLDELGISPSRALQDLVFGAGSADAERTSLSS